MSVTKKKLILILINMERHLLLSWLLSQTPTPTPTPLTFTRRLRRRLLLFAFLGCLTTLPSGELRRFSQSSTWVKSSGLTWYLVRMTWARNSTASSSISRGALQRMLCRPELVLLNRTAKSRWFTMTLGFGSFALRTARVAANASSVQNLSSSKAMRLPPLHLPTMAV